MNSLYCPQKEIGSQALLDFHWFGVMPRASCQFFYLSIKQYYESENTKDSANYTKKRESLLIHPCSPNIKGLRERGPLNVLTDGKPTSSHEVLADRIHVTKFS